MQLFHRFQEKDLREAVTDLRYNDWKDYDDCLAKHHPQTNNEAFSSYISMLSYYNGVGILVHQGLLDIDLVEELLGRQILGVWQSSEFIIKQGRERSRLTWKKPSFQDLELLANQIKQRIPKQATSST